MVSPFDRPGQHTIGPKTLAIARDSSGLSSDHVIAIIGNPEFCGLTVAFTFTRVRVSMKAGCAPDRLMKILGKSRGEECPIFEM